MQTPLCIEALPVEIIETITTYLEFADVCNLRRVAREIASKASQDSFRSHFSNKRLLLQLESVEKFEWITRNSSLARRLERLTVVEVVPAADSAQQIPRNAEQRPEGTHPVPAAALEIANPSRQPEIDMLTDAFTNIKTGSVNACLQCLTVALEGQDRHGPIGERSRFRNWSPVGIAAATAFYCVSSALTDASLHVHKLDLFYGLAGCALECDRLALILEMTDLTLPLRNLQSLSLCLTHHSLVSEERSRSCSSYGRQLVKAIADLIKVCPTLHTLEVRWYNLRITDLSRAEEEEQHFFDQIANGIRLSSLRHLTLKGVYATEQALMSFFLRHGNNLLSLDLEELHLHEGTFQSTFDYIFENFDHLQQLRLNDLFESQRLVQFEGDGKKHFEHPGGPTQISRCGADIRKAITYNRMGGRIKGSSRVLRWWKNRSELYGPP